MEAQGGKCPLCLCELLLDKNTCIDHCHDSLIVRGILCRGCNMVVSRIEDDSYMIRVEHYLDRLEVDSIGETQEETRDLCGL